METVLTSGTFLREFNKRKSAYLATDPNDRFANKTLHLQASALFLALIILWLTLYVAKPPFFFALILACIFGAVKAGIGFVMHEAAHGTFSKKDTINKWVSYSLNLLGGHYAIWDWQHQQEHHKKTNVSGQDRDIDVGKLGRFSKYQPRYSWHQYQHIYLWPIYALSYIGWKYYLDFGKAKKMGWGVWRRVGLFFEKLILNYTPFLIIPLLLNPSWQTLVVVVMADLVCGFITSSVFQPAHVVEGTEMFPPETETNFDAIRQIKSTANFGIRNKFLLHYLVGLNFQLEHHLVYGTVSYRHYPKLHEIVMQILREYGATNMYVENKTFLSALQSHYRQLKKLGASDELPKPAMFI